MCISGKYDIQRTAGVFLGRIIFRRSCQKIIQHNFISVVDRYKDWRVMSVCCMARERLSRNLEKLRLCALCLCGVTIVQ